MSVDQQFQLPPETDHAVNPKPAFRNFKRNNERHKILVAIIDTGADYNHPYLKDSFHFSLDEKNHPQRLGWDFIGRDGWPSPYIGRRTSIPNCEIYVIEHLIQENEGLEIFLNLKRNVLQEYLSSAWHGTDMAGLIAQDNDPIGLLVYRAIPPNAGSAPDNEYDLKIIENIIRAAQKAAEDGANIVVTTSFFHYEKDVNPHIFSRVDKLRRKYLKVILHHKEVLFMTSAGNGNGYRFNGLEPEKIDFPAGIIADNFLVVGSASEDGKISDFSNIPQGRINAVFYPGKSNSSFCPQEMLCIPEGYQSAILSILNDIVEGNESYRSLASYLLVLGTGIQPQKEGTSFSAAGAANICSKLWQRNRDLTPKELIDELKKTTVRPCP